MSKKVQLTQAEKADSELIGRAVAGILRPMLYDIKRGQWVKELRSIARQLKKANAPYFASRVSKVAEDIQWPPLPLPAFPDTPKKGKHEKSTKNLRS